MVLEVEDRGIADGDGEDYTQALLVARPIEQVRVEEEFLAPLNMVILIVIEK